MSHWKPIETSLVHKFTISAGMVAMSVLLVGCSGYSLADPDKTVTLLESMMKQDGRGAVSTTACKYFESEVNRIAKKNNSNLGIAIGSRPWSSENSSVSDFMYLAGDCIDSLDVKWILTEEQKSAVEFRKY